jgi:hypothetical protein
VSSQQLLREDAANCEVEIDFRPYSGGEIVILHDGAQFEIIVPENTTAKRRACIAKAVETLPDRLHAKPSGSKKK